MADSDTGTNRPGRAQRILQQIMQNASEREDSVFSKRTYADEPILRTGADLRREQEEREKRRRAREESRRQAREAASARRERAHTETAARPPEKTSASAPDSSLSAWDLYLRSMQGAPREEVELPPALAALRTLEQQTLPDGRRLSGTRLFAEQAILARDLTDDLPYDGPVPYRYLPTYQELTNRELRGYFTWRTSWRAGTATTLPYTFARILAGELVNGVGAEPGEPCLRELQRLLTRSLELDARDMGPNMALDIRRWIRDYVVYHGLDPKLATTQDERDFAQAVATLRAAEAAVFCSEGIRDHAQKDMPTHVPTDAELWAAMGEASTYRVDRSPFFRKHPEAAAQVGAEVFRKLASHCGKRRKTTLTDGLFGWEGASPWTPFLGLPFWEPEEHADVTVRLTACETISHRFGRWRIRRGYEYASRNRELGRLVRAIDRQMRLDWNDPHPLKERQIPKYLDRFITKASAAALERERDAERRKITIDLSQLGHIRSAAAVTREALLVDEEKDEDAATATAPTPAVPAVPPTSKTTPAEAEPADQNQTLAAPDGEDAGQNPCGLTDLELEVLRRILDEKGFSDLLGSGKPMESVLVDSINEKFFDEIGDSVIEYGEEGPRAVEDYVDDVRDICGL